MAIPSEDYEDYIRKLKAFADEQKLKHAERKGVAGRSESWVQSSVKHDPVTYYDLLADYAVKHPRTPKPIDLSDNVLLEAEKEAAVGLITECYLTIMQAQQAPLPRVTKDAIIANEAKQALKLIRDKISEVLTDSYGMHHAQPGREFKQWAEKWTQDIVIEAWENAAALYKLENAASAGKNR